MTKNAIFWIREDFRIEHNPALSYARQNHDNVIAIFIYNKSDFDKKREAQKWWLYKSLEEFKSELFKYKINLQILEGDELDVLSKIKKKDNISVYWNYKYNLKKSLSYANEKKINYLIIVGENEKANNNFSIKNISNGKQDIVNIDNILDYLK